MVGRNEIAENRDMRTQDGKGSSHLVRSIGREPVHRQLQTLGFERAGAQGLERLRHAAQLVGTSGGGYRLVEFAAAGPGDRSNYGLHRTRQSALNVDDGKSAEGDYRSEGQARNEQQSRRGDVDGVV